MEIKKPEELIKQEKKKKEGFHLPLIKKKSQDNKHRIEITRYSFCMVLLYLTELIEQKNAQNMKKSWIFNGFESLPAFISMSVQIMPVQRSRNY